MLFQLFRTESFRLVSVPKIAHLSANVNPALHKKSEYIGAPDFSSFTPNIRTGFYNLARKPKKKER